MLCVIYAADSEFTKHTDKMNVVSGLIFVKVCLPLFESLDVLAAANAKKRRAWGT